MADLDAALATADRLCPKCERVPSEPGELCPSCGCRLVELAPDAGLVGAVVDGRFEIRGLLGEGGMGTVYRAWQRSVGREVAIEVIDRKKVRDAMTVRRFLREAKLASQLAHPNTVSVIDFGQAEDRRLFIAMELVRGRTLADAVARAGGLGLVRAVGIGIQLCDALEAAHGLAIVHRDLKPANVILVDDPGGRDRIKVLDFGLAKSLIADDSESTQTGDIVGTPRYLAPELAMGEAATPQSDLYAVGVMLVELCTGRRLFEGARMVDLMRQKAIGPQVPSDVPPALAAIVARLIDPDPIRRPASAAALRASLEACLAGADVPVVTTPRAAEAPVEPTVATGPVRYTATPASAPVVSDPIRTPRSGGRGWILAAVAVGAGAAIAIGFASRGDVPASAPASASAPVSPAPAASVAMPPDASIAAPAHPVAAPAQPDAAPADLIAAPARPIAQPATPAAPVTAPDRSRPPRVEPRHPAKATAPATPAAITTPTTAPTTAPKPPAPGDELPF